MTPNHREPELRERLAQWLRTYAWAMDDMGGVPCPWNELDELSKAEYCTDADSLLALISSPRQPPDEPGGVTYLAEPLTAERADMIDDILRWTGTAPDVLLPLSDGTIDLLHSLCFMAREDGKLYESSEQQSVEPQP